MKITPTGVVRKVDELGRLVIPVEVRKKFDIEVGTPIEIYTIDNGILLQKYQRSCIFCRNAADTIMYEDKLICSECVEKINEVLANKRR